MTKRGFHVHRFMRLRVVCIRQAVLSSFSDAPSFSMMVVRNSSFSSLLWKYFSTNMELLRCNLQFGVQFVHQIITNLFRDMMARVTLLSSLVLLDAVPPLCEPDEKTMEVHHLLQRFIIDHERSKSWAYRICISICLVSFMMRIPSEVDLWWWERTGNAPGSGLLR